eukprot:COSAG02_NODE_2212_length_9491_cov_210.102215_13_plen_47_part_01
MYYDCCLALGKQSQLILQHMLYESSTANRIARFGTFSNVTARLTNNH